MNKRGNIAFIALSFLTVALLFGILFSMTSSEEYSNNANFLEGVNVKAEVSSGMTGMVIVEDEKTKGKSVYEYVSGFFREVRNALTGRVISVQSGEASFNQLKNIDWNYTVTLSVADIPTPEVGAYVKSLYSPAVIKLEDKYVMFFGVSIYCRSDSVARDSVAVAESIDGINDWQFIKYVLEPNPTVCSIDTGGWSAGTVFQINDPKIVNYENGIFRLLYTSAEWQPSENIYGCGNIGIATIDLDYNITSQNDRLISGADACTPSTTGYSRPDLQWLSPGGTNIWFDTNYAIKYTPFTSYIDMNTPPPAITLAGLAGGDINLPKLSYEDYILIYQNSLYHGLTARDNINNAGWSAPWNLTVQSGEAWDSWFHGSGDMILNEDLCEPSLYFAGFSNSEGTPIGTLAVAEPPSETVFDFSLCSKNTCVVNLVNTSWSS